MRQQTIRRSVALEGIGLHSGKRVRIALSPAPADSGIVFRVGDGDPIPAAPESVVDSHYATTIGRNSTRIYTVEHLMAAAAGLGIDNLDVEVDGVEVPAMDGSAKPFVALLHSAGRTTQGARRRPITIQHPIHVGDGNRWLKIVPASEFRISYTLDNDHPAIGTQVLSWTPTEESFVNEYAPARTYGFLKDLGFLRKNGRALGGSLDNTIVIGKSGTLNGLRVSRRVRAPQGARPHRRPGPARSSAARPRHRPQRRARAELRPRGGGAARARPRAPAGRRRPACAPRARARRARRGLRSRARPGGDLVSNGGPERGPQAPNARHAPGHRGALRFCVPGGTARPPRRGYARARPQLQSGRAAPRARRLAGVVERRVWGPSALHAL